MDWGLLGYPKHLFIWILIIWDKNVGKYLQILLVRETSLLLLLFILIDGKKNLKRCGQGTHTASKIKIATSIDSKDKWYIYNWLLIKFYLFYRMNEFKKAVQNVDDLTKALQREDLTSEEYKDLQNKYEVNT